MSTGSTPARSRSGSTGRLQPVTPGPFCPGRRSSSPCPAPLLSAQSIYQDDPATKGKGVESLIQYATLSKYMLVPLDMSMGELRSGLADVLPERIPSYGERGWWYAAATPLDPSRSPATPRLTLAACVAAAASSGSSGAMPR